MTHPAVAIYSTPTCHFCGMTKEFFKEHNVEYVEHNVAADVEKRKEMIEKSGQMGVPVITIGENVIVGYDEEELRRLLAV